MKYNKEIVKAEFINRPNRFHANVIVDDKEVKVHVPNTGRCREILVPGCTVYLRKEDNEGRKTPYDLIAAIKEIPKITGENTDNIRMSKLISIDSHIPNKVIDEALKNGKVDALKKYTNILKEKTFGSSRFDFKLSTDQGEEYFLEVKGVTLEENEYSRFPDAPTERGARHLMELVEAKKQGYGAGVMFLIQLEDVNKFSPHDERDPKFGEALRYAAANGVDIFAYNCIVTEIGIEINEPVEIIL